MNIDRSSNNSSCRVRLRMTIVAILVMKVMRRLMVVKGLCNKSNLRKCPCDEHVLAHLRYGVWIVAIILMFL
ncbi:hypothetical protein EMCG_08054 [[Emmonsia] crescens]|uniref:Uncharacterized protein n=1 Tax=[Emmonsia] crescens TaxID=73230 RepID=A0A0G2I6W9_9EURO|nr:hypothetical protein EMCG_08054 [Emmonsia crescens UAMH 3008]